MPTPPLARFTTDDAVHAWDEWGANCGPGAIAGILGLSLDDIRPHMGNFESKRYTNPALMERVLNSLDAPWRFSENTNTWPAYGLARVQWEGPWTEPGVPDGARQRQTHWVAAAATPSGNHLIFDINCICVGGWVSLAEWSDKVVPWLLREVVPGANGRWHLTHVIEIEPPTTSTRRSTVTAIAAAETTGAAS